MDEDGVLLRRSRFAGGRSGGPTEGELDGVRSACRGSVERRRFGTPLGAIAGIVADVARDELTGTLMVGMWWITRYVDQRVTVVSVAVAKTGITPRSFLAHFIHHFRAMVHLPRMGWVS